MSEASTAAPAPTSTWHMYRAMVGVGVCCGLLIVGVFQATRPVIERNKAEALRSAIFRVLPDATASTTFRLGESGGFTPVESDAAGGAGERLVYAGYDDDQELVGLAVEAQGMGYQDVIRLIYGYSFSDEAIIGMQVLESKETPGLGDKIETDPSFLENFERLDVSLGQDQSSLAHPIVPVRHGNKTDPWEVDGITGATISSEAIANILNQSAQHWIPLIQRNLQDFRGNE
ncbi:MAG TPA: FMN-binding protein [Polyangiales bacterium]|nr:FMN-binding protein [Polyangiales bacterium]